MRLRNRVAASIGAAVLLASSTLTGIAQVGNSDTETATVKVNPTEGGTVTPVIEKFSFAEANASHLDQWVDGELQFAVVDNRGTNSGWTISGANSGEFTGPNGSIPMVFTASGISQGTWIGVAPNPGFNVFTGVWQANAGSGAGIHNVVYNDLQLKIPANTYAGEYTGSATLTVDAAP